MSNSNNLKHTFHPSALKYYRRVVYGMSVDELAIKLKVHPQTVSNWEHGSRSPSEKNLALLAKAFRCSVEDLCTEILHDFRETALDSIQAKFHYFIKSKNPKEARVAIDIYKHLFPEPLKVDIDVAISEGEKDDSDLLDEGETPNVPEGEGAID